MKNKTLKEVFITLVYNDKEITVKGENYYKKEDDNGKEIKGNVLLSSVDELAKYFVNESDLKKMIETTTSKGFTFEKYLEVHYDGKEYKLPLNAPSKVGKKLAEEVVEYAKNVYFDLYMLGQYIKAENEIPELIKKLKKGTEFTFDDYFKMYHIDEDAEIEHLFKILLINYGDMFVAKDKAAYDRMPYNMKAHLTYIKKIK